MKAASFACSRRWSSVLISDVREICPCLPNAQQTRCEGTDHRAAQRRDELAFLTRSPRRRGRAAATARSARAPWLWSIDGQIEFGRLLDRELARFCPARILST